MEFVGWAKHVKAEYKVKKEIASKELASVAAASMFPEVVEIKFQGIMFVIYVLLILNNSYMFVYITQYTINCGRSPTLTVTVMETSLVMTLASTFTRLLVSVFL